MSTTQTTPATPLAVIVLAAGKGTRMNSDLPKVLHPILGAPMLQHVLNAVKPLNPERTIVITGHGADAVEGLARAVAPGASFVRQIEQRGTGHAVQQCEPAFREFARPTDGTPGGTALILLGDSPCITTSNLQQALAHHRQHRQQVTFITTQVNDPTGFGRIVRNDAGNVTGIVEHKNCTPEQLAITEVNTGHCLVETTALWPLLTQLQPNPPKNELYLTDILHLALAQGLRAGAFCHPDGAGLLGVNTPEELARMAEAMAHRLPAA